MVTAIVQAATFGGFDLAGSMDLKTVSRKVCEQVGIENFEDMWKEMYPNYDPQVDDGTGQPEEDEPGAPAMAHPKLPTPSFGAESARMVRRLAEALSKMDRDGKLATR